MGKDFNPRLREGGDFGSNATKSYMQISIHASAKEATVKVFFALRTSRFQSTPPRRRRRLAKPNMIRCKKFQSTPPRRRRRINITNFMGVFRISIHASAKEATFRLIKRSDGIIFQSTPPRRRRPQHIVIPQLSCTYLVSTTFLSAIFSFISQYVVLFFLF